MKFLLAMYGGSETIYCQLVSPPGAMKVDVSPIPVAKDADLFGVPYADLREAYDSSTPGVPVEFPDSK